MKTTAIILFSVFMVFAAIKTYAQVLETKTNPKSTSIGTEKSLSHDPTVVNSGSSSQYRKSQLKGVEGRIFIGADWPAGKVVLRDGGSIENYLLRYNLLSDQMQFIAGQDTLAFASPDELNTVTFDGHTFIYENFECGDAIRQGYFELIVPGKNKLLLKRVVTYQIPDPKDESSTKYLIDDCYFISKPGKAASKLMCNRKSALSVLNEHNEEIEEYLRITGNKVRSLDDLKKLVAYYNALEVHE